MSCCGLDTVDGLPPGGGAAAAEWTERFLGDYRNAPVEDLTVGINPTVLVANETTTTGSTIVASALLASNANDPVASSAMGTVTAFGTDGATGLALLGAAASTLFTDQTHTAPHVFALWPALIGENPRPGVDYCVVVRFATPPQAELVVAAQAAGVGVYWQNDGVAPVGLAGFPTPDDEKGLRGWAENVSGVYGAVGREDATAFQEIFGARVPADADTFGLLFRGGGQIYVVCSAGPFVSPDEMTMVPGAYQGGSITYPARPYLDPTERVCLSLFQQQLGGAYNLTAESFRVLSRGGRV
jgi:hypothetical protein